MSAYQAAVTAFTERALVPAESYRWDDYAYRLLRYALAEGYYSNTAYSNISAYATKLKVDRKSYKHLRSLYNPVNRLVEFYVAKIYGGELDFESLTSGAIPLLMASDPVKEAIRQLWQWSNWRSQKSVYVRYGTKLGDVALKVVDEPDKQKVRIEVVHPGKICDVDCDSVGNVKRAVLEYECDEPSLNRNLTVKTYIYREEIDQEMFRTFKDGKPFAYFNDARGNPVYEWRNEYGFVPLVLVKHLDMGLQWGASPFHAQYPLIDEINDQASLLNDSIRKMITPIWYMAGVQSRAQLSVGDSGSKNAGEGLRDEVPMLYGPVDSQPHSMAPTNDITSGGENLDRLLLEAQNNNPELALATIREGGDLTAPGVEAAFNDGVGKIKEAQGNYDDGTIRAFQMGMSIGGYRRYDGFQAFSLDSYDRGDLQFYVKPRPIIRDSLSKQARINALTSIGNLPTPLQRLALEEMDIDKDVIDKTLAEIDEKAEQKTTFAMNQDIEAAMNDVVNQTPPTNGAQPTPQIVTNGATNEYQPAAAA